VTDQALPARVLSAVCRASTGRFWTAGEPPGTARHPDVGLARQTQPPQAQVPPRVGGCAGGVDGFRRAERPCWRAAFAGSGGMSGEPARPQRQQDRQQRTNRPERKECSKSGKRSLPIKRN